MSESGIKFRPVMGTEDRIKNTMQSNGWFYVATDTGAMFLDVDGRRIAVGGVGGSGGGGSTGFYWADVDEEAGTIIKMTDDASDGDPVYYISASAVEGGVAPTKDGLILNADGRFFRVTDVTSPHSGFVTVELIAVSGGGSGGGGGGSSTVDLELNWSGIDLLGSTFIYQKDAEITFIPNSTADEVFSLAVSVKDAKTGVEVYSRSFRERNKTKCIINAKDFPLPNDAALGLTMSVTLTSDHSTYNRQRGLTKEFKPIKVLRMYLEKPTDVDMIGVCANNARLSYNPYYTGLWTQNNPVKIYYTIDGGDGILSKALAEGNDQNKQYIDIPHQPHGTHVIGLYLSVVISGQEFTSDSIYYEVPFIDAGNEDPIIWTQGDLGTIIQYEPAVVRYMVYSSVAATTGANIEVQFLQDGVLFDSAEITYNGTRWQTLDLTSKYVLGDNHFSIVSGGTRKDIDFMITGEGARNLDIIHSDELEINFDSMGRSNKQIKANRTAFISKVEKIDGSAVTYSANLNGFNWYNNGWLDDNDGNGSYLAVSNGASVSIPFKTIDVNTTASPWTFEMRFRIRNAKKFATLVTEIPIYVWKNKTTGEECASGEELPLDEIEAKGENFEPVRDGDGNLVMNEANTTRKIVRSDKYIAFKYLNNANQGFAIGTQEAYFNVGGRVVNVKYREDEIINISFVVDKAKNQLSIYLNGILSGVGDLSGIVGFTMSDVQFLLNSEYCDFDLYKFRVYPLALTMPEIIHNYISDIKSTDLYDENQLTDINDDTKLSYQKLIAYNNDHPDNPTMPYVVIDLSGKTSTGNDELPFSKTAKGIDGTRIEFTNPTADYLLQQWLDQKLDIEGHRLGITPWEYYTHCPSYTADNVNINVQGTSSQIYPRRNFKTKFKKAKNWVFTQGPLAGKSIAKDYYFNADGTWAPSTEQGSDESDDDYKARKKTFGSYKKLAKKWHVDSEEFGTNKFTWKIDYMESSGSYNTGFANLMGNGVYSKHPLEDLGISGMNADAYRTSVYGFPMLAFHKDATGALTYIGRYNMNLDKGSNEYYGFEEEVEQPNLTLTKQVTDEETGETSTVQYHPLIADVAECWELRDNQGLWCSFRYPTNAKAQHFRTPISDTDPGIEVVKHFEARYHKYADQFEWGQNVVLGKENTEDYSGDVGNDIETINGYLLNKLVNLEALFDWLDSTDPKGFTNAELAAPVTYKVSGTVSEEKQAEEGITYYTDNSSGSPVKMGTFTKDSPEYRRQKFYAEFDLHLDKEYCAVYFVMTELLLCYDSRGKNMMIATFGPTPNSQGNYVWYPIFYDIDTQLGLNNVGAKLWDYDEDCTENGTFSTAQSVLWTNFNDLFKSTILSTYRTLRGSGDDGKLSYKNIEGAYNCDPTVFKSSLAMRGRRPLIAMGLDEYYKYVLPVTVPWRNQKGAMITANYLYACQGDRKLSRELLINNRLLYMDSKWLGGTFTISSGGMAGVMFRSTANHETTTSDKYVDLLNPEGYNPGDDYVMEVVDDQGNVTRHNYKYQPYQTMKYIDATPQYNVTPYLNFYVTTFVDENTFQNNEAYNEDKYPNGIPTKVLDSVKEAYQYGRVDQQLNYFAGSEYISSLGDLSTKYANQVKIPDTPRLLDITLGSDAPDYFNNENLNPFELYTDVDDATGLPKKGSTKSLLNKIILSNLRGLNTFLDVRSPDKLTEFRALGTNLTYALFAEGAPLDTVHLPNTTQRLLFIQNKNLKRILTSTPVVADMVNGNLVYRNRDSYKGLFVDGLTNWLYDGLNGGAGSPIYEIDMEGDAMGYDSYTLLNNLVLQKYGSGRGNRLSIKMTDVNWTPYTQVEYGESKQDGVNYYYLTDHSTYEPYTNPGNEWANDTLNGKVFTFDATAPKATISDLSLLNIFLNDYADTSTTLNQFRNNVETEMSNKTYPAISGQIFVANGNAEQGISETDLSRVYGEAWPNLVIRAEKVEMSYLTKYVEIDPNSNREIVLDNKAFSDEDTITLAPASRLKVPTRTHYDFQGFSPVHPSNYVNGESPLYVVRNATNTDWELTQVGAQAYIDASKKAITLYAIFIPHNYQITYVVDAEDRTKDIIIDSPYGSPIVQPSTVPYKSEAGLPEDRKYAFLGWNYSAESLNTLDMSKVNVNRNLTLYAIFQESDVHSNPISTEYLQLVGPQNYVIDGDGHTLLGYTIGLKPQYSYQGKVTLPSYIDGVPVLVVMAGSFQPGESPNGICQDNNNKNNITHIFWDTTDGEPKLARIDDNAFYGCMHLEYVELPDTLDYIGSMAFSSSYARVDELKCRYISEGAFNSFKNNMATLVLRGSVAYIGANAFSFIETLRHVMIGAEGEPSQLKNLPDDVDFFGGTSIEDIIVYTDGSNNNEFSKFGFTNYGNLYSQPTLTILPA